MFLYSVYQPAGVPDAAERAVFVRQGFDRLAFLLTPAWALRHRLWRMFGLWALWTIFAGVLASTLGLDPILATLVYAIGALAFGYEADRAREEALSRRGMLLQGLSLGETTQDAERIFFDRVGSNMMQEADSSSPEPIKPSDQEQRS